MGYQELKEVVSAIHEVMPNIAIISDTLAIVLGVCNVFFSISLAIESQS